MEKTADILWKSCANGNNESFKSLFDTWYEPLCLRHLARQRGTQINRPHRSPKKIRAGDEPALIFYLLITVFIIK